MAEAAEPSKPDPTPRTKTSPLTLLLLLVILALTGALALSRGIIRLPGIAATSILVYNDTPVQFESLTLSYPGGALELPMIPANESVGSPIYPESPDFDATLAFKVGDASPVELEFPVRVLRDLLIEIHVLPVLEPGTITAEDGREIQVIRASDSEFRVLVAYSGERSVDKP